MCLIRWDNRNTQRDKGVEYIIVGGWSPFLLNANPIPHPGTKDVDVLFKSGTKQGELKSLIEDFIQKEFIQSAKDTFTKFFKDLNIQIGQDIEEKKVQ